MANKDRKNRDRKIIEREKNQPVYTQKPTQENDHAKSPGQAAPGAVSERSSDRHSKGKARP
jgi:hypothetical protein